MNYQLVLNRLCRGAAAGTVATAPMTLVMESLRWAVSGPRPDPFVPRQVAEGIAQLTGISKVVDRYGEPGWWTLTAASHFGYGGAAGSVYGLMDANIHGGDRDKVPAPRVLACGAAFGFAVWAASYLALLPALGIIKPQTERPVRKNFVLIVSHLVWGATTAACFARGRKTGPNTAALRSVRSMIATHPDEAELHPI